VIIGERNILFFQFVARGITISTTGPAAAPAPGVENAGEKASKKDKMLIIYRAALAGGQRLP
jgi:hypothetical protein